MYNVAIVLIIIMAYFEMLYEVFLVFSVVGCLLQIIIVKVQIIIILKKIIRKVTTVLIIVVVADVLVKKRNGALQLQQCRWGI